MSGSKKTEGAEVPSASRSVSPTTATAPSQLVIDCYSNDEEHVMDALHTSLAGLSASEVAIRQEQDGKNELEEEEDESLVMQFLDKFQDPMVVLLLCSACISLLMRQWDDAISIVVAVIIVSTVGFVQEYKSEKAVQALKEFVAPKCIVVREGNHIEIEAAELVVGDIVILAPGCRVPADLRLVESVELQVNESLLTGESEPVQKYVTPIAATKCAISDRLNMVCMGATVSSGTGKGVVVCIGKNTELGKIFQFLQKKEEKKTPLQISMDNFGKQLSIVSSVVIVLISVIGFLQGKPPLQMFNMAVSLVVAAIPEGLPIAVTVTLALGVTRMSHRKAIVRKLPAVEALGATNVICVDKTGTLTQNKMTVTDIYCDQLLQVEMTEPVSFVHGTAKFVNNKGGVETLKSGSHLYELIKASVCCNNARFNGDSLVGLPTEGALLSLASKAGLPDFRSEIARQSEVPFSSLTKWMGVTCGDRFIIKGAPEVVVTKCTRSFDGSPLDMHEIQQVVINMSSKALRVLAFACSSGSQEDMTFLGLVGVIDPPRPGVKEAIASVKHTGIHVVMITGDSKDTAIAVASQLGLTASSDTALSASDIDQMSPEQLKERVSNTSVFYRMTPAQKVKIVNAYKSLNMVTCMTGDGVNDAPAVSRSDIGIAMGAGGSDVCKEAAEIILVDNNFSTIVAAIEEGKVIFNNIKNFLHFQLTTSVAAMGLIAFCSLADLPLPLNPMQILWINIIMDGPPAQSLTFEANREATTQRPRDLKASPVDLKMIGKICLSAFLMVVGTMWIFLQTIPQGKALSEMNEAPKEATTIGFTTFVLFQLFNAFNCRSFSKSVLTLGLFSNIYLTLSVLGALATQMVVIYLPFLQLVFRTSSVTMSQLGLCVAVASSVLIVDELWKLFSLLSKPKTKSE
ncbi:calcium-transporting P-type ATPase, PMR1-type [Pelomyxa schiedti]|nr:calcium-transporting P-type ATPase, PMR1-type [Pelomyxa schiedti]